MPVGSFVAHLTVSDLDLESGAQGHIECSLDEKGRGRAIVGAADSAGGGASMFKLQRYRQDTSEFRCKSLP